MKIPFDSLINLNKNTDKSSTQARYPPCVSGGRGSPIQKQSTKFVKCQSSLSTSLGIPVFSGGGSQLIQNIQHLGNGNGNDVTAT